jgi:hypothetical protein
LASDSRTVEAEYMIGDTEPGQARVFISYRHDEMDFTAGWLYERLAKRFGRDQVFEDVDSIESGVDFVEAIISTVSASEVLIALIGKQWLTFADESGGRHLDAPATSCGWRSRQPWRRVRIIPDPSPTVHACRAKRSCREASRCSLGGKRWSSARRDPSETFIA